MNEYQFKLLALHLKYFIVILELVSLELTRPTINDLESVEIRHKLQNDSK